MGATPMQAYRSTTRKLAKSLKWTHVYYWLIEHGYFPESYVLPPCFRVRQRPNQPRRFVSPTKKHFKLVSKDTCNVQFPKTDLTDVRRQINPDQWVCFVRETSCRFTVLRGVHRFSRLRCASVLRLTCSRRARIAGRRPA